MIADAVVVNDMIEFLFFIFFFFKEKQHQSQLGLWGSIGVRATDR